MTFKRPRGSLALLATAAFASPVMAQDATLTLRHDAETLGAQEYSPVSEVSLDYRVTPRVTASFAADMGQRDYLGAHDNTGLRRAALVFNTAEGRRALKDNWRVSLGLLGYAREMAGSLQGRNALSADEVFLQERLTDFAGLRLEKKTPFARHWSWDASLSYGRTLRGAEEQKLGDAFDFIRGHGIDVAPALRREIVKVWDDAMADANPLLFVLRPDLAQEGRDYIANIPDRRLQDGFWDLIDTLRPFFPLYNDGGTVTNREYAGIVAGVLPDRDNIGHAIVSDLFDTLRAQQGDSGKASVLFRSGLTRATEKSHFTLGAEGGRVMAGRGGTAPEDFLGLFTAASRAFGHGVEAVFAAEIAGFRNYLNLDGIDNAMATVYTGLEWSPAFADRFTVGAGLGKSYHAVFGEQSHRELSLSFDAVRGERLSVTLHAATGRVETEEGRLMNNGTERGKRAGVSVAYNIGK